MTHTPQWDRAIHRRRHCCDGQNCSSGTRRRFADIARRMTYVELCADNSFTEEFMAAMFLPHTDITRFPAVKEMLEQGATRQQA